MLNADCVSDLLESFLYFSYKYIPSVLGTEDDVVLATEDTVAGSLIFHKKDSTLTRHTKFNQTPD